MDDTVAEAHAALGHADLSNLELSSGIRALQRATELNPGLAPPSNWLAHLAARRGDTDEARLMLAELIAARGQRVVSAWGIAALHASLRDVDESFHWLDIAWLDIAWLDIAVQERATGLMFPRVHPRMDAIRGDARYSALVQKLGLVGDSRSPHALPATA